MIDWLHLTTEPVTTCSLGENVLLDVDAASKVEAENFPSPERLYFERLDLYFPDFARSVGNHFLHLFVLFVVLALLDQGRLLHCCCFELLIRSLFGWVLLLVAVQRIGVLIPLLGKVIVPVRLVILLLLWLLLLLDQSPRLGNLWLLGESCRFELHVLILALAIRLFLMLHFLFPHIYFVPYHQRVLWIFFLIFIKFAKRFFVFQRFMIFCFPFLLFFNVWI